MVQCMCWQNWTTYSMECMCEEEVTVVSWYCIFLVYICLCVFMGQEKNIPVTSVHLDYWNNNCNTKSSEWWETCIIIVNVYLHFICVFNQHTIGTSSTVVELGTSMRVVIGSYSILIELVSTIMRSWYRFQSYTPNDVK